LAEVRGEELAGLLEQLWGQCALATWKRNRGAVAAWLAWCATSRLPGPVLPASAERRREHINATRAVPRPAIERALSRRDVPLREKTLWRMLYETAARASEVLALTIEDLDARRAAIRSKAATPNGSAGASAPRTCWPASSAAARPGRCGEEVAGTPRVQPQPGRRTPKSRFSTELQTAGGRRQSYVKQFHGLVRQPRMPHGVLPVHPGPEVPCPDRGSTPRQPRAWLRQAVTRLRVPGP
jgi:hypothetical protein